MTVRLSPHKVSRILRLFFHGMPQPDIAEKAGVDQSTVSLYASRFRNMVGKVGLLTAGKESGVFNEVDTLRSLSVELTKADLTVEDCRKGMNIIKAFLKLGIKLDQHAALVKVCKAIDDPGFVQAAVKLSKIQTETNTTYEQVISQYENITYQLPSSRTELQEVQTKIKSLDETLVRKKHEAARLETHIALLQAEAESKEAKLEQKLAATIKKLEVKQEEVEEVATLKRQLGNNGLDILTLVKLAKEYGYGSKES